MNERKYTFFLGGNDAEMTAIKEILVSLGVPFFDKNLLWGAKLSVYTDQLKALPPEGIPVLVELALDVDYPDNTIIIDHHNDKAGTNQKTSLEQTADLLNIRLNRRQQLISANDKNYIPEMKAMGASQEEIKNIRAFDRKCQGVTEDDEKKAEISIQNHTRNIGKNGLIVHSLTEKTSPVTDRLYGRYDHLFIITPSKELNYFGTGPVIQKLENIYEKRKNENKNLIYWKGGNLPHNGFFGANSPLDENEIEQLIALFQ